MRSSPKIAFAFVFMAMTVGCAAPLTQLQRAEQAYTQSEAEKKKEEEKARVAQAQADAARQAETTAKEGLATALVTDAQQREDYVKDELRLAKEARDRACTLNPKLEGCKVEPPAQPVQQPAAPAPTQPATPAAPAPVPPTQATAPEPPYVDYKMNDFSAEGMQRLTYLPLGWNVGFDEDKGYVILAIDGVGKYEYRKPAQFKPGICYRFMADKLVACPAATPPAP